MTTTNKGRSGEGVLGFLDGHRLDHTPQHYAFAYEFLFGSNAILKNEVLKVIDGGVRISREEVAKLATTPASDILERVAPKLDEVTVRVLDIIRDTVDATGSLNQNLVRASASLLGDAVPNVRSIISAVIAKTAATEQQLLVATEQAQRLRDELNSLRKDVNRDHLTDLTNRAGLEERLRSAVDDDYCLAMVDVDHFKQVNDTHGHGVGDRVLKLVATTLQECCAPHLVGRWGGEEFIVMLEGVDLATSIEIINRARDTLASKRLRVRDSDRPLGTITFSAGVAAARGRASADVIEAADRLLYQAKRTGRNCVIGEQRLIDLDG